MRLRELNHFINLFSNFWDQLEINYKDSNIPKNQTTQKMSTEDIYFDEIVENFIKLVQAVHEVGDSYQKAQLSRHKERLNQVISLIEPEKIEPEAKKAKIESEIEENDEKYESIFEKYDPQDPETYETAYKCKPNWQTILSKAPTLKKLNLEIDNQFFDSLDEDLKLPKLKYLSLYLETNDCASIFQDTYLPSLERLYIYTEGNLDDIGFFCEMFLENAPNLKSIQLEAKNPIKDQDTLSDFYDIVDTKGVFVCFGTIFDNDPIQRPFLEFMMGEEYNQDPQLFVKYGQMLRKFTKWCSKNPKFGKMDEQMYN